MSDILKNLKSLFIEDAATSSSDKKEEETRSEETVTEPELTQIDLSSLPDVDGQLNPKFTKILLQAIEKHNLTGFDYLEFKNGLKSLAQMNMDEATRFKSAYAMAKTMGASKSKLLDSAAHYQSILDKEKQQFEKAAEQQMKVKVLGKKDQMKLWEQDILAKEKQVQELQKSIADLKAKLEKVSSSLDEEALKVKQTKMDFLASYQYLHDQIATDIQKMKDHIEG
jgi:hypothetical protein